ncbi:MAG: helix-turn-helix transcriptional regulator [Luteolibacter sp.]
MPKSSHQPNPFEPFGSDPDFKYVARLLTHLREERARQGISLRELAAKSEISFALLSRGERLERIPAMVYLRKWVRGLGLDWLAVCKQAEIED